MNVGCQCGASRIAPMHPLAGRLGAIVLTHDCALRCLWLASQLSVGMDEDGKMSGLLQGHVAAVTGGASGIGQAIALGYAREGARVVILDSNGEGALATAKAVEASGGK